MDTLVRKQITAALETGRMAHSVVISGGTAAQRLETAKYIAAAEQCERGGGAPCMACLSCRKVMEDIHPDVEILRPENAMFSAAQAKSIRTSSYVRPNEGNRHIFIFPEAETLTVQDQNILLKTLEEPPGSAMFILCAENPGILLPTVRSRCVIYHLEGGDGTGETDENAAALMATLEKKSAFACAKLLRGLEKLKREEISSFLSQCRSMTARSLRDKYTKNKASSPLTAAQLVQLGKVFETAEQYNKNNCASGHLMGYLAAACWEALN